MFFVDFSVLKEIFKTGHFVAHNAIFEIQFLTHQGFPGMNIGCSMLLSQLLDAAKRSPFDPDEEEDDEDKTGLSLYKRTGHSLDAVVQRLLGMKVAKTEQISDWGKRELTSSQINYAGLDALLTYKVATIMAKELAEMKMVKAYKLLKDMQHVVAHMQLEGLPVDWEYHTPLS